MIDATRSPRPLWKRIAIFVGLIVCIALAAWFIWVKELHHKDIHVRTVTPAPITLTGNTARYLGG